MQGTDNQIFIRNAFTSIYLTMLGIIQAGVFAYLMIDVISNYKNEILSGTEISLHLSIYQIQALATLTTIILVTYEYCYFVLLAFRPIRIYDICVLFGLGIAEFVLAASVGHSFYWWIGNILLGIAGIFAYTNTLTYNFKKSYGGDMKKYWITVRHTLMHLVATLIAAVFSLIIVSQLRHNLLGQEEEMIITIIWVAAFGLFFFISSDLYVRKIFNENLV